jgi:hypothetical protein
MAKPTEFPQQNLRLKGDHIPNCSDMMAFQDETQIISRWVLSDEELEMVKITGAVWLHVGSGVHPPVYIGGLCPFVMVPKEE